MENLAGGHNPFDMTDGGLEGELEDRDNESPFMINFCDTTLVLRVAFCGTTH